MMDKTLLNCAAVLQGGKHRKDIFTYIYGDCNEGDSIIVFGFSKDC